MSFSIVRDGDEVGPHSDKGKAIAEAYRLLSQLPEPGPATFAVFDVSGDDPKLVASVTNRRIIGTFYKQFWGGRKGDDALPCGEEEFDGTNEVLMADLERLHGIEDNSETTDEIGMVEWSGPRYVEIVDSICRYFGVDDVEDITQEALEFARERENPQQASEETATLTVKLRIRASKDVDLESVLSEMDYRFSSATAGAVIAGSEIVAWERSGAPAEGVAA